MAKTDNLKVFRSNRGSMCDECGADLGRKAWIALDKDKGALCRADPGVISQMPEADD